MNVLEACDLLEVNLEEVKASSDPWQAKTFLDEQGCQLIRVLIDYIRTKYEEEGCL